MEFSIHHQILLGALLLAAALGAAMHLTRFCTLGGISDWVNMEDKGRLGAWLFAIAVATGGVLILEALQIVALQNQTLGAFPPYRTAQFAWLRYLLGGLLFGAGMTLAGGCPSRSFVRAGSGSLKSLLVVVVAGIAAYFMLWTDLYQKVFLVWIAPTTVNLARWGVPNQELGTVISGLTGLGRAATLHLALGGLLVALLLFLVVRWRDFRSEWRNPAGGAAVGAAVIGGWMLTGGPLSEAWGEHALLASEPPIRVAAQSFTFISPMGDAVNYLLNPKFSLVSFGLVSMIGVILGSFAYAVVTKKFHVERFTSVVDFINHIAGAILIGVGGVLAMGCSVGQGVTGVSTLALGSMLALGAMIAGCVLTLKAQYFLIAAGGRS